MLLLCVALVFAPTGAGAMWARYSKEQLIEASDLIVVGAMTSITSLVRPSDGVERTIGIIEVDSVLKGPRETKIVWIDLPQQDMPIKSTDIGYTIGQQGLWFLRLLKPKSDGIYVADHPQRFVPYDRAGPQIEALRKRFRP